MIMMCMDMQYPWLPACYGPPLHDGNSLRIGLPAAASEGFGPFIAALLKAFWIDGLYAITSDKLEPNEPFVLATELYPDIKFITVEEYFKSRA